MDKLLQQQATQASIDNLGRVSPAFEEGYIKGALAEREVYGKLLLECAVDEQSAMVDIALAAYCNVECQRKEGMPCAHLADGGCTNYRKLMHLMKGDQQ